MPKPVIAVISVGAMGAGVGARLTANGVDVITSLAGRSKASIDRAEKAGMRSVSDAEIATAPIILSIVPPSEAPALAKRLAPHLKAARDKPLYIDCNAVSSPTAEAIGVILAPTGCDYADGGIIGPPPREGARTIVYVRGVAAARVKPLSDGGLVVKVLDGAVGAASALKMSYAAITKGLTGLGTASILAASRYGAAAALADELTTSQPNLVKFFSRSIPEMFSKAYRFDGEMQEISTHTGRASSAEIYSGIAKLYEEIGRDFAGPKADIAILDVFVKSLAGRETKS
jgi:3-hydroxyisobutyrate dehydrogenase-like beta-hydroxyacid dehydrogenase